jgi:hypothetical protein
MREFYMSDFVRAHHTVTRRRSSEIISAHGMAVNLGWLMHDSNAPNGRRGQGARRGGAVYRTRTAAVALL